MRGEKHLVVGSGNIVIIRGDVFLRVCKVVVWSSRQQQARSRRDQNESIEIETGTGHFELRLVKTLKLIEK